MMYNSSVKTRSYTTEDCAKSFSDLDILRTYHRFHGFMNTDETALKVQPKRDNNFHCIEGPSQTVSKIVIETVVVCVVAALS